jgi:hypothetical protein
VRALVGVGEGLAERVVESEVEVEMEEEEDGDRRRLGSCSSRSRTGWR